MLTTTENKTRTPIMSIYKWIDSQDSLDDDDDDGQCRTLSLLMVEQQKKNL